MNKKLTLASIITLLITPAIASAANFVVDIINRLLNLVVWPVFLGLIIIMFIWAGILYLTARGDPEKFKKANLAVVFAIIGIIVAILGYKAVATVRSFIPGIPLGGACTASVDCDSSAPNCVGGICQI